MADVPSLTRNEKRIFEKGNVGVALYSINDLSGHLFAHSSINQASDPYILFSQPENEFVSHCALIKKYRIFETIKLPARGSIISFDRKYDTEAKILEEIAALIGSDFDASGEIHLFTERYPCISCDKVLEQFRNRYTNIKITVYYEKDAE